ncbi:unnamed protein product [Tuwongella immobilis]|uniref:Uncharacterized protein n=1 Tax=Tuwongella immobilis TaxID=692036 RepID=A0A6C2YKK8_9BACT|nr:unnamed protein product [Tuwongella immobilis]VTR99023.1 unnamed protein product [Tuwongella immobilis]
MRPDAEAPLVVADEVGVPIGDTQIIDRLPLARLGDGFHRDRGAIQRAEPMARRQRAGFDPAERLLEERMLGGGVDRHSARERQPKDFCLGASTREISVSERDQPTVVRSTGCSPINSPLESHPKEKGAARVRSPWPSRCPGHLFCSSISMNGTLRPDLRNTPTLADAGNNFMQVAAAEPCPSRSQSVERGERKCRLSKRLAWRPARIQPGVVGAGLRSFARCRSTPFAAAIWSRTVFLHTTGAGRRPVSSQFANDRNDKTTT